MPSKKIFLVAIILAMLLIPGLRVAKVEALPAGSWVSGIKVQNLDSVNTATITVKLYKPDGTLCPACTLTKSAGPLGSVELYLPNYTSVPGGRYSAVVSSNTQIAAVATQSDDQYGLGDSYSGMEGATRFYVPFIYRGYSSWSSEIFVQNTSATTAHVYATMFGSANGIGNAVKGFYALTLNGNGSGSFNVANAGFSRLGATFFGSAIITSTENAPLAVAVNNSRVMGVGDVNGNLLVESRGLTDGDAASAGGLLSLPTLYNSFADGNGLWGSIIRIQNSGAVAAKVNVTFRADPGRPAWTGSRTNLTVLPGTTYTFNLANSNMLDSAGRVPTSFKGSGVINVTAGQVVAMVQNANYTAASGKGIAESYVAFDTGYSKLFAPTLYAGWPRCNGTWVSTMKLQNIGPGSVNATITFKSDPDVPTPPGPSWSGIRSISLSANQAVELALNGPILNGNAKIPTPWKGSAWVSFTGTGKMVGTVRNTNYSCHSSGIYPMLGQ